MNPNRANSKTRWFLSARTVVRSLTAAGTAVLALGAMAAPVFRPYVPDRYVVVLEDPPVGARFASQAAAQSAAAADYRRQIAAKQGAVLSELAARNIQVTSQSSLLLNAVFVSAPGHSIDELRAIPGVRSVTPLRRMKAHLNRAIQLMNAQAAWSTVGGQSNAGKGIKIAILDSGLDLGNAAFHDSSLSMPSGYPLCSGFPGASTACSSYTNSKVIVARSYMQLLGGGTSSSNPAANSDPDDPYPHDRFGHGTAVAMVAAGNTISAPAAPVSGSALTMQGMAPKAYIGIYKISGTFGFTNEEVEIQALEDAIKDGMDVINMSYGGLALTGWKTDPLASAFETAATTARPAGSLPATIPIPVIVTSAGNDGSDGYTYGYNFPSFNTINSPSTAPDVISVGAATNSHIMTPSVSAVSSSAPSNVKNLLALAGDSYFYPSLSGANTAALVDVSKVGDGTACSALPANSLSNSFALISYGACGYNTPAFNAQNAGAAGFIYILPAGTTVAPFDISAAPSGILEYGPSAAVSNADGVNLKNYIDAHPFDPVTIDLGGQEQDVTTLSQAAVPLGFPTLTGNMVAGYSSFGPTPDGLLKPDLIATGGWDPSAHLYGGFYVPTQSFDAYDSPLYSANGFMAEDGTSLAAPLVAGAAALVIQAHPGLRGTEVRSLIVDSTSQSVTTDDSGNPVDAQWLGAGLLDAGAAAAATISAEPATISFGILQSSSLPISKTITVTNVGSSPLTLTSSVSCCKINGNSGSLSGITASLSSGAVAAGGNTTLTVTMAGPLPAPGEYSGSVSLQASGSSVHIPFLLLVGAGTTFGIETNFTPEQTVLEGTPGTDTGPYAYVQVTDQFGVPVSGATVSFTVAPSGSLTLGSASGHPPCQSAPSSSQITCPTDSSGWAWMDVMLGSTASQPYITYSAAGYTDYFYADIQAAPTITPGGVADAASYQTTLVPGSYAAIFGSFAGLTGVFGLVCPAGLYCPYPISFDTVSVSFDVPGATYPGYPYFVGAGQYPQVNLVVPRELDGQTSAQVKVSIDGDLFSNVVTVPIAASNPAFIQSCGAACALDTNYKVISSSNPAKRGQFIFLYANGLGPVNNPPGDGVAVPDATSTTTTTPVVTIGGAVVPPGDVQFSGLAPGFPALYQINVKVPQAAQTGNVAISLQIGGVTSPVSTVYGPVTIPVQ